jgi:macrolide-specific efflux system membrane fusion protein
MRKRPLLIALIVLLVAAGAFAVPRFLEKRAAAKAPAEAVATVTRGSLETIVTAQGKLEPKDYVDVGAQVSGLVQKLNAEVGDAVNQGDLIAEIDPAVYDAQVKGSEARLKTLEAQQAEQQALVNQAQQKHDRSAKLIAARAISTEVLEDATTTLDVARAKLASLTAQIEEAQSTLEGDRANLSYTKIYAPMTGTVVSQSVKEGQTINANQTAPVIVQIAKLDVMTAKAQVAEADIPRLAVGTPVYFTTLGGQDRRWEGTVRQLLPSPETVNDVVLYNVLADVENTDGQLMNGMTTQMFFVTGRAADTLLVPTAALGRRLPDSDTERGLAYEVVLKGGAKETVIVDLSDRAQASVVSGLDEGDEVLMRGPAADAPGTGGGGARRMMGMGRL